MVEKVKYALVLDKENFIPSPTPKHEEWKFIAWAMLPKAPSDFINGSKVNAQRKARFSNHL